MSRSIIVKSALSAAALLLAVTGCGVWHHSDSGQSDGPRLVEPSGGNEVTATLNQAKPGDVASFGGMIVCLDRDGSITITDVQTIQPQGDATIHEWGVRPSPWWKNTGQTVAGVLRGDLEHNHYKVGKKVNVTCDPKTGRGYELAVSMVMPDKTRVSTKGLRIVYVSDGELQTFDYSGMTLALCPTARVCAS